MESHHNNNNNYTKVSSSPTASTTNRPRTSSTNETLIERRPSATMATTVTRATDGQKSNQSTKDYSIVIPLVIFVASVAALCYVYVMFPQMDETERQHVKIPFDIEDAKQLAKVLDRYKDMYYTEVMTGIVLTYIFLQTFAIPGSLFLSILSGFLFHFPVALTLVCFCSALGATLCYSLSQFAGRRLVKRFFPERAAKWTAQIEAHKENLFSYMLFLRMTPILPNWFINLVAPVIGVPLAPFAIGTFFGVAPPSVIAIQAGKTLHTMTSSSDAFSLHSMLVLAFLAILSIVPALFKNKLKAKLA